MQYHHECSDILCEYFYVTIGALQPLTKSSHPIKMDYYDFISTSHNMKPLNNLPNQKAVCTAPTQTMYADSIVDKAIHGCFLLHHKIAHLLKGQNALLWNRLCI